MSADPGLVQIAAAAAALGFVFNAAPGAVFAETVRHALRGGFRPAFGVQVGSLVGDATWAVLGLSGAGLLMRDDALRLPVGLVGAGYLLWLAVDAWRAASAEFSVSGAARPPSTGAVRAGMLLSLTNPQNIAFWAAIGSAMGTIGVADPGPAHYAAFFGGFMASSIAWAFICAAAVSRLFRDTSAGWAKLTYRLCAAALFALALASLRDLAPRFNDAAPPAVRPPMQAR